MAGLKLESRDFTKMTLNNWILHQNNSGITGRSFRRHLETIFSKQQTFILWSIKPQSEEVNSIWVNFKFILRIKRGNETFEWDDNERMYQCMPWQFETTWENEIFRNSRIIRRLDLNWIRRSVAQNEDTLDLKWPYSLRWVCIENEPLRLGLSEFLVLFWCYFMRD